MQVEIVLPLEVLLLLQTDCSTEFEAVVEFDPELFVTEFLLLDKAFFSFKDFALDSLRFWYSLAELALLKDLVLLWKVVVGLSAICLLSEELLLFCSVCSLFGLVFNDS